MPDAEAYPQWGRRIVRGAVSAIYTVIAVLAAHAVVNAPDAAVRIVGLNATMVVAAITAITALVGGLAHTAHLWLVERAAIPFTLTGTAAFDIILWVGTYRGTIDVDLAGLATIPPLFLAVRAVQLELFSLQGRRA